MKRFVKTYSQLFEDNAVSISVPDSLMKDIEVIRDHSNSNILKQYGAKIESFTYSGEGNNQVKFLSNTLPTKAMGVMGAVLEQVVVTILLQMEEQTAHGPVVLDCVFKQGPKKEYTLGEYFLHNGKISFVTVDEDGNLEEDNYVAIGESEFAVNTSSVDINDVDLADTGKD